MDTDLENEMNAEQRHYNNWVREEKNRILKLNNTSRKQSLWNELFPQAKYSEEINNMVF